MLSKRSSLLVRMSHPPPPPSTRFLASIGKDKDGNTEKLDDDQSLMINQSAGNVFVGIMCAIIVPLVLWISGSALETFLLSTSVCASGVTTPIKVIMCDSEKVIEKINGATNTETKWKPSQTPGYIDSVMGLVREHTIPKVTTLASILVALALIGTGFLYWIIGAAGWGQFLKETWSDRHPVVAGVLLFLFSFLAIGILTLETYLRFIWHCITMVRTGGIKRPDKNSIRFLGFVSSLFLLSSVMIAMQGLGGYQVVILIMLAIACTWATHTAASGATSGRGGRAAEAEQQKR